MSVNLKYKNVSPRFFYQYKIWYFLLTNNLPKWYLHIIRRISAKHPTRSHKNSTINDPVIPILPIKDIILYKKMFMFFINL